MFLDRCGNGGAAGRLSSNSGSALDVDTFTLQGKEAVGWRIPRLVSVKLTRGLVWNEEINRRVFPPPEIVYPLSVCGSHHRHELARGGELSSDYFNNGCNHMTRVNLVALARRIALTPPRSPPACTLFSPIEGLRGRALRPAVRLYLKAIG